MSRIWSAPTPLAVLVAGLLTMTACGSGATPTVVASPTAQSAVQTAAQTPAKTAAAPIKIAVILSLTGSGGVFGVAGQDGLNVSVDHLNKNGGVDGRPIQLQFLDDESRPEKGVALAEQVAADPSVVVVTGLVLGNVVNAIVPVLEKNGVPALALAGALDPGQVPNDPSTGKWIFRAGANILTHAQAILQYLKNDLKKTKIAIEYQNSFFPQEVAKRLKSEAAKYGVEIVADEETDATAVDVTPNLRRLVSKNPDVIISAHLTNMGVPANNWKSLGTSIPLVLAFTASNADAIKTAEAAVQGVPIEAEFCACANETLPRMKLLTDAFQAAKGREPTLNNATAWDLIPLLAAALKGQPNPTRDSVRAAMERVSFDGAAGVYRFSATQHQGFSEGIIWVNYTKEGHFKLDPVWSAAHPTR